MAQNFISGRVSRKHIAFTTTPAGSDHTSANRCRVVIYSLETNAYVEAYGCYLLAVGY